MYKNSTEKMHELSVCLTNPRMRSISSALVKGVTVWYKNIGSSSAFNHCWLFLLFVLAPAMGGSAKASTLKDGWMGRIDLDKQEGCEFITYPSAHQMAQILTKPEANIFWECDP